MIILVFLFVHWYLAGFCQTFYLHRYASHRMFTMPVFWERFFYVLCLASQGIFCLPPRPYAVMHRMHHAYIDSEKDPHSPRFHKSPFHMAVHTAAQFIRLTLKPELGEARFDQDYPVWPAMDRLVSTRSFRTLWAFLSAAFFIWIYRSLSAAPWQYLLLPVHFFVGPILGMIINWQGHKNGYRNFDTPNDSSNVFSWDIVMLGEGLHNNHHSHPRRMNFAVRRDEWDPTYSVLKLFGALGILRFNEKSKMR